MRCVVQASNIDSLNAFLPGPAYAVRQSAAFFQRSGCFLSSCLLVYLTQLPAKKDSSLWIEILVHLSGIVFSMAGLLKHWPTTFSFFVTTQTLLRSVCRYTVPMAFDGQFWILSQSINQINMNVVLRLYRKSYYWLDASGTWHQFTFVVTVIFPLASY